MPRKPKPKVVKIIVAKPPRRGVYVFNGMPTMPLRLWKRKMNAPH